MRMRARTYADSDALNVPDFTTGSVSVRIPYGKPG